MIHLIDHVSKHKPILAHKHHASIILQEFIPRDKPCVTPRVSFASNCVSDQKKMNLENVKEVFFHNKANKKKILHCLHKYHGLGSMSKIQVSRENCCTFGVTLGNQVFSYLECPNDFLDESNDN